MKVYHFVGGILMPYEEGYAFEISEFHRWDCIYARRIKPHNRKGMSIEIAEQKIHLTYDKQ